MDGLASAASDAAEGERTAGSAGDGLVTTCLGTTPSATTTTASSASATEIAAAAGAAGGEATSSSGAARCSSVSAGVGGAGGGCDGGFEFGSFSVVELEHSVSYLSSLPILYYLIHSPAPTLYPLSTPRQ